MSLVSLCSLYRWFKVRPQLYHFEPFALEKPVFHHLLGGKLPLEGNFHWLLKSRHTPHEHLDSIWNHRLAYLQSSIHRQFLAHLSCESYDRRMKYQYYLIFSDLSKMNYHLHSKRMSCAPPYLGISAKGPEILNECGECSFIPSSDPSHLRLPSRENEWKK